MLCAYTQMLWLGYHAPAYRNTDKGARMPGS